MLEEDEGLPDPGALQTHQPSLQRVVGVVGAAQAHVGERCGGNQFGFFGLIDVRGAPGAGPVAADQVEHGRI